MGRAAACIALAFLLPSLASAQDRGGMRHADPDWPCPQRLVMKLTAGQFWTGDAVDPNDDWRSDPAVAALVRKLTPRTVSPAEGESVIRDFMKQPPEDRRRSASLAFAGLLDEANAQRAAIIDRIRALARRQRDLADIATRSGEELRQIPTEASGEAAARREDLTQRRLFVSRAFEEAQRTIGYACEIPVQLETRLGIYARALQDGLS